MIDGGRVDKLEQLLLESGATVEAIDMCLRSFIGSTIKPTRRGKRAFRALFRRSKPRVKLNPANVLKLGCIPWIVAVYKKTINRKEDLKSIFPSDRARGMVQLVGMLKTAEAG
jgi:hypothetical protein